MPEISEAAAAILDSMLFMRELDRSGNPHLLVKVPDVAKIAEADIGLEVRKDEDGALLLSLLLYDIPTEPIAYEMRFIPSKEDDLRYLKRLIEATKFRMHPAMRTADGWVVGPPQTFRIPSKVLLTLKHHSLEWPALPGEDPDPSPKLHEGPKLTPETAEPPPQDTAPVNLSGEQAANRLAQPDPRDLVIKKLKEQNHILRDQLRAKDKRIIELEDELNDIKSKGRNYKLGDKRSWWNPF